MPLTNSPINDEVLVNVSTGNKANGSCKLMTTFNKSFKKVRSLIPSNTASSTVGSIAIDLVNKTLCHLFHCKFRKP